jgi:hypothetical protein
MAVSNADVQAFLELPINENDAAMTARIEFSKRHVKRAGVSESHESYDDLVILAVCVLMEARGLLTGALSSKSIGDVSTSFKNSEEEPKSWAMQYKELLTNARGLTGRIA